MDQSFEYLIRIAARESMEKNSYKKREVDGILMILHQVSEVVSELTGVPLQIKLMLDPNNLCLSPKYDLVVQDKRGVYKQLDVRIYSSADDTAAPTYSFEMRFNNNNANKDMIVLIQSDEDFETAMITLMYVTKIVKVIEDLALEYKKEYEKFVILTSFAKGKAVDADGNDPLNLY